MCQSLQSIFLGNILFSSNLKLRSCRSSVRNKELPHTLPRLTGYLYFASFILSIRFFGKNLKVSGDIVLHKYLSVYFLRTRTFSYITTVIKIRRFSTDTALSSDPHAYSHSISRPSDVLYFVQVCEFSLQVFLVPLPLLVLP